MRYKIIVGIVLMVLLVSGIIFANSQLSLSSELGVDRSPSESSKLSKDSTPNSKTGPSTNKNSYKRTLSQSENESGLENEIKKQLEIPEDREIRIDVMSRLIQRKEVNEQNFKDVVNAVTILAETTEEKELLSEELLGMEQGFVERYSETAGKSSVENRVLMRQQIRVYLQGVKEQSKIRIGLNEARITALFNKEIAMDELIYEIWNL